MSQSYLAETYFADVDFGRSVVTKIKSNAPSVHVQYLNYVCVWPRRQYNAIMVMPGLCWTSIKSVRGNRLGHALLYMPIQMFATHHNWYG